MNDLRIARVTDDGRLQPALDRVARGLELAPPVRKRTAVDNPPHQRGFDQPARKKIVAARLVLSRITAIAAEPEVGALGDQPMQRTVLRSLAVVECKQECKRRVAVRSGARRIRRPRQKVDESFGERERKRGEDLEPAGRGTVVRREKI